MLPAERHITLIRSKENLRTFPWIQKAMKEANDSREITTEISAAKPFYYAEDEHQQYLYKNPHGYCGLGGIGVCLPPQL